VDPGFLQHQQLYYMPQVYHHRQRPSHGGDEYGGQRGGAGRGGGRGNAHRQQHHKQQQQHRPRHAQQAPAAGAVPGQLAVDREPRVAPRGAQAANSAVAQPAHTATGMVPSSIGKAEHTDVKQRAAIREEDTPTNEDPLRTDEKDHPNAQQSAPKADERPIFDVAGEFPSLGPAPVAKPPGWVPRRGGRRSAGLPAAAASGESGGGGANDEAAIQQKMWKSPGQADDGWQQQRSGRKKTAAV